ncbi:electron transfer flavoprotein subunit beta/FixA family protein [Colwellia sp. PAMC 21821]|uniref:electron transfer flavoprotein subunit beta/FixA family protein n=1 Tax=Colwellia sp. PAMC 21821 TaxID=1816219 RepID=UPI0009BFE2B3|nr:electron transfer flavoprotein subunit beta/FixA family protein [Colwellia sp. PAMC 21821]ARD43549.1 electron transfer flavoprotein subunit beta [Colwellia sp. PAMC 21821]
MNILVAVKRTIDANIKAKVKPDRSDIDLNNIKMAINPFCEIAVEEAIRLKERGIATKITVVSIGSKACQEQIRTALALGADNGILIETADSTEPLNVAKLLSKIIIREQISLTILGKQSIDADNNQTGQMLAALNNMPQATFASEVNVKEDGIEVTREVDGGLQTLRLSLPAVITTDLRLNEPRYASLPNIMKAKRKPLEVTTPDELGVVMKSHIQLLSMLPPIERKAGIKVNNVDDLLEKLKFEAKVIS